ncbi:MAG: sn-glycerol-3-phosphate ABC transporter ATP-binding protein UgpC [Myxococcaceae bacterium]|nr:sn-glycerol-3-phosphate ABC transporter ATP-binding protein UgpC [Myxococcaceae bacterium]
MSEVILSGIQKAFGDNLIVKGVDLQIRSGEFLVMLGPSGCGKTTLLRLIAGLEQIDEGELRINGRRMNEVPPRDRDVAMVFQSYALYPHMTVRENMAFGLTLRKMDKAEIARRVQEAAQLLELSDLLDRKPKQLSGGQRQRVAMGRAIVRQPSIFLFDEPLSNLDTALRVQMRGELARLHRRLKATMIYVTHDQVEAMTLATRVAVFNGGLLQQCGEPLELYHRPANRFVGGFLGSPSMNFVAASRTGATLSGQGFSLPAPADLDAEVRGDLLLGLRPQDLRIAPDGVFRGEVEAVERLGFDGFAFIRTEAGSIAARFDKGVDVKVGDRVAVAPVGDAVHVFTADGTKALRHPSLPSAPTTVEMAS